MIPTTLVYQMGKVGSTSINHALHKKDIPVLHVHWMQHDYPEAEFSTKKLNFAKNIKRGESLPLKVIVPIREPVSRNLSAFFQCIERYVEDYRHATPKEIQKAFINKYNIFYPDTWFEKELMDVFKFNPYNYGFNWKKGYEIYSAGKHKILIIRLENTEEYLSEALYNLLGISGIEMLRVNDFVKRREGTFLGEKYREVKKLKFPKKYLNKTYNLKYAKHFWSDEEIKKFKEEKRK